MKRGIRLLITIVFLIAMVSAAHAVSQPVIHTSSLPKGVIRQGYSAEIAAKTDTTTTIHWIIIDGKLPDGLTLDAYDQDGLTDAAGYYHGWIHGTPTKTGTITITEGAESTITTHPARSLGSVAVGEEFSVSLASLGKYKHFSGGELPPGLDYSSRTDIVDSNGNFITTIEGIPTQEGVYTFFVTTCNKNSIGTYSSANSHSWSTECNWEVYPMILTVNPAGTLQNGHVQNVGISAQPVPPGTIVTPSDFPSLKRGDIPIGTEGEDYTSGQFTSSGNILGVIDGVLPDGLQLSSSNVITGIPVQAGIYTSIIASVGYQHLAAAIPVTIAIDASETPEVIAQLPKISTQSLDSGTVSEKYSATIAFTGAEPVTFSVTEGEFPEGLTLEASTGKITGTPTTAGSYRFTVQAANSSGWHCRRVIQHFCVQLRDKLQVRGSVHISFGR